MYFKTSFAFGQKIGEFVEIFMDGSEFSFGNVECIRLDFVCGLITVETVVGKLVAT